MSISGRLPCQLPRPGKVWDDSGPSLSELLARRNTSAGGEESGPEASASEPGVEVGDAPAESFGNVEPVIAGGDLSAAWGELLESMKGQQGLHGVLSNAQLVGVEDDQAVIRFSRSFATFTKMLEKNGKKDLLRESLSKSLGRAVGVRFEIEEVGAVVETPANGSEARPVTQRAAPPRPAPVEATVPSGPPAVRITPELVEQMKSDPLVAAVMENFNATPVKIE